MSNSAVYKEKKEKLRSDLCSLILHYTTEVDNLLGDTTDTSKATTPVLNYEIEKIRKLIVEDLTE